MAEIVVFMAIIAIVITAIHALASCKLFMGLDEACESQADLTAKPLSDVA